jgi:hypothetical protein
LACRLEQISILLFHWMSIHGEINHMRHDNKTHTQKRRRGLVCCVGGFYFIKRCSWHVTMERTARLDVVMRVLKLWAARHRNKVYKYSFVKIKP